MSCSTVGDQPAPNLLPARHLKPDKLALIHTDRTKNIAEKLKYEALQRIDGLEILTSVRPNGLDALEIDFVIRLGNQVGVIETKTKAAKKGIDQIQAVAEQRYLGAYVSKFLVSGQPLDENNKQLARAYNIAVVETDYADAGCLRPEDVAGLINAVQSRMGRKT